MRCVNCWKVVKPEATVGGNCIPCAAIVRGRRAADAYAEALRAAEVRRAATVERLDSRRYGWAWAPAGVDRWTLQADEARAVEELAQEGTPADEREERREVRLAMLELSDALVGGGADWAE